MEEKKMFFFCMTVCHYRIGAPIGRKCGTISAQTAEEAENLAWSKFGSDAACKLWVEEIPQDGYCTFIPIPGQG